MGLTTLRLLVGLALLGAPTLYGGQAVVERPGARQPVAPAAPRVTPLAETQWTDAQRETALKYARDGRTSNALACGGTPGITSSSPNRARHVGPGQ